MDTELDKIRNEYESDRVGFIRNFENQIGGRVLSCKIVDDNECFIQLCDNLEYYFSDHDYSDWDKVLKPDLSIMFTLVEFYNGYKLKIHNAITFYFYNGSHIRFSPHGVDGIELSRIVVKKEQQGRGIGSAMMEIFLTFLESTLGYVPRLFLECTGGVGIGDEYQANDISTQTRFFRKFGFRVDNRKLYPTYVTMVREKVTPVYEIDQSTVCQNDNDDNVLPF